MSLLKKLLGTRASKKPTWNIRPPQERPAPRSRENTPEPAVAPIKKEKNPFLDADFNDMEIVNDIPPAPVDPYASSKWKIDQDKAADKLRALNLNNVAKDNADEFNPYDTGVFRRGWKD